MEANFYKTSDITKVLPKLVETIIAKGNRLVIAASNMDDVNALDNLLWAYSQLSFLGHGTCEDEFKSEQPVYITTTLDDNPNGAKFIAIVGEIIMPDEFPLYEKYLFFIGDDKVVKSNILTKLLKRGITCYDVEQTSGGQWLRSETKR